MEEQRASADTAAWHANLKTAAWVLVFAFLVRFLVRFSVLLDDAAPREAGATATAPVVEGDDESWKPATSITEKSGTSLRVRTRARRGELGFRIEGTLDASVVELVSLVRETDLMPTWNAYAREGRVVRLASPTELWAYADFRFWPLPIPPMYVALHATLDDRVATAGHVACSFRSPPPDGPSAFDRSAIPPAVAKHAEMVVPSAKAKLFPVARPAGLPPRTDFESEVLLDLSLLAFLGPVRHLHPPQWMVTTITKIMMPAVWRHVLRSLERLHADGGGAIGARILADESGLYRKLRQSCGQPDVATRERLKRE